MWVLLLVTVSVAFYAVTIDRSSYLYILRADEGYGFSAAVRTASGQIPQKDFSYAYGPIMPFVYAVSFKLLGVSLYAMRATWALLYTVSVVLFYGIARQILPALPSATAAICLVGQLHPPLYSYNHVGLVIAVQAALLLAMRLLVEPGRLRLWAALSAMFTLAFLIKFNEGLAVIAFLSAGFGLWLTRKGIGLPNRKVFMLRWLAVCTVPVLLFAAVTFGLNYQLTAAEFWRNFPVLPEYHASVGGYQFVLRLLTSPVHLKMDGASAWKWWSLWYENYVLAVLASLAAGIAALLCLGAFFAFRLRDSMSGDTWNAVLLGCCVLALYHEFYLTGNHWATPMYLGFAVVFGVWLVYRLAAPLPAVRYAALALLFGVSAASCVTYYMVGRMYFSQYDLSLQRARIRSSSDSDASTVQQVVDYIQHTTPAGTAMAAFPHDSLLLHLAGLPNGLRDDDYQWMLFPTEDSDAQLTAELKRKQISRLLISNFVGFRGRKLMFFGQDYLPQTYQYILSAYHPVQTFDNGLSGYAVTYYESNTSGSAAVAALNGAQK